MRAQQWHTLKVCAECLHTAADGPLNYGGYWETGHAERYRAAVWAYGAELVAACSMADHGDPDTGEPCTAASFSWAACDWCGDIFGGDRYCASVYVDGGQ